MSAVRNRLRRQHLVFVADLDGSADALDEDNMIAPTPGASDDVARGEKETSTIVSGSKQRPSGLNCIDDLMHSDL